MTEQIEVNGKTRDTYYSCIVGEDGSLDFWHGIRYHDVDGFTASGTEIPEEMRDDEVLRECLADAVLLVRHEEDRSEGVYFGPEEIDGLEWEGHETFLRNVKCVYQEKENADLLVDVATYPDNVIFLVDWQPKWMNGPVEE